MKLKATKREVSGKKVKHMRKEGRVPAALFGAGIESKNIEINEKEFIQLFKKVGYNKFFDLEIGDEKPMKVLVKDIQIHPIKDYVQTVGIYKIDDKRKITVDMPLTFTGTSKVETDKVGFLVHNFDAIKIHAFPKDIPEKIEIDVTSIENPGDAITASDIKLEEGVELDSSIEPTNAIVYAVSIQKLEAESLAQEAAAEASANVVADTDAEATETAEGGEAKEAEGE